MERLWLALGGAGVRRGTALLLFAPTAGNNVGLFLRHPGANTSANHVGSVPVHEGPVNSMLATCVGQRQQPTWLVSLQVHSKGALGVRGLGQQWYWDQAILIALDTFAPTWERHL